MFSLLASSASASAFCRRQAWGSRHAHTQHSAHCCLLGRGAALPVLAGQRRMVQGDTGAGAAGAQRTSRSNAMLPSCRRRRRAGKPARWDMMRRSQARASRMHHTYEQPWLARPAGRDCGGRTTTCTRTPHLAGRHGLHVLQLIVPDVDEHIVQVAAGGTAGGTCSDPVSRPAATAGCITRSQAGSTCKVRWWNRSPSPDTRTRTHAHTHTPARPPRTRPRRRPHLHRGLRSSPAAFQLVWN